MTATVNIQNSSALAQETLFLGASVFVPVPVSRFYEALLDVRNFPRWAPAVRRVEILDGIEESPDAGMISEWEVSLLSVKKRVRSVLEKAENAELLRWSYKGPVEGWGECRFREQKDGTLARFTTEIRVTDAVLRRLACKLPVRSLANSQLRRSLAGLGKALCGNEAEKRVLVGSPEILW